MPFLLVNFAGCGTRCQTKQDGALGVEYSRDNFGVSQVPLCISAFAGRFGQYYVYKVHYHPDYARQGREWMFEVALTTAAAPTDQRAVEQDGCTLLECGIWVNNPIMVGVVDALSCIVIQRRQLHVLSLGTGHGRFRVGRLAKVGGRFLWAKPFVSAATAALSHNALVQDGLFLGRDRIGYIDGPETTELVDLTDVRRAVREFGVACTVVDGIGQQVADRFLSAARREAA